MYLLSKSNLMRHDSFGTEHRHHTQLVLSKNLLTLESNILVFHQNLSAMVLVSEFHWEFFTGIVRLLRKDPNQSQIMNRLKHTQGHNFGNDHIAQGLL